MTAKRATPRLPSFVSAPANDNGPVPATPPSGQTDESLPATPTPERLAKAGGNVVSLAGAVRLVDRNIDRLHRAGLLDPDPKRNNILHIAADQYLADYYNAGLAPLGAVDYGRPPVDGKSPKTDSDFRAGARTRWNGARADMKDKGSARIAAAVDFVVLHDGAADVMAVRIGLGVLVARYGLGGKR